MFLLILYIHITHINMLREQVDDLTDSKPVDWVESEKMPDPAAVKPADWDEDQPRTIPDPSAVRPEGWAEDAPAEIPDPEASKPEDWLDDEVSIYSSTISTRNNYDPFQRHLLGW